MRRRKLLLLTSLFSVTMFALRRLRVPGFGAPRRIDYGERAVRLNQLAAGIESVSDARTLVNTVVEIFFEHLPVGLVSRRMRNRTAEVEFAAATDAHNLIPEQRVADAWNTYVRTIGAPRDCEVSVAEVHNLRDGFLTTAQLSWKDGRHNIWAVPAIYATGEDGGLAVGCRAIESARLLWDIANMPENLKEARVRVSQDLLLSDVFRQAREQTAIATNRGYMSAGPARDDPVRRAGREFLARNGKRALDEAVKALLNDVLA